MPRVICREPSSKRRCVMDEETTQKWTVIEWGVIDGDLLGALIECVVCKSDPWMWPCEMCNSSGTLHQPYRMPNGSPIDLYRYAELLIQIEPPDPNPKSDAPSDGAS